jgi:hypothetical protein
MADIFFKGEVLGNGDIYFEFHRVTEEEFEMWDQPYCIAIEE